MANVKISELASATTALAGTEVLPIVQSSATVKVSVANLTAGRAVSASSFVSSTIGAASGNALSLQSNGTTNATLDASGRLGLGTTSMTDRFTIATAASASAAISIQGNGVSSSSELYIGQGGSNEAYFFNRANNYLVLGTNDTERARITATGNLLLGTTSNAANSRCIFSSSLPSGGANPLITFEITTTANAQQAIFINGNGTVGSINTSGTTTSYITSSDYRLKNTIAPITGALAKVALLKPVTYKWNVDGSDGEGFIAHELAEVVPQAVAGTKDDVDKNGKPQYQGIDTSFLVATLTAAIQELKAEFDAYKALHP